MSLQVNIAEQVAKVTVNEENVIVAVSEVQHVVTISEADKGDKGDIGIGIPPGGSKGQRLVKKSIADYDTEWIDQTTGIDKTVLFQDGDVVSGDADFRWDKNTQSLIIGKPDVFTNDKVSIGGALDDYLQATISNTDEGTSASADWIATNDKGTDDAHYIDVGINSSVYDDPDFNMTKANDAYVLSEGGDLILAPITEGKRIILGAGGATSADTQGYVDAEGIDLVAGKTYRVDGVDILKDRPLVFYGTTDPPSPVGLSEGTLYFKHEA